jgi:hypothetical protein
LCFFITIVSENEEQIMPDFIQEHSAVVRDAGGGALRARVYGEQRADGTWVGWVEFHPEGGGGRVLRTGRETSQPNREALAYWASGLEPAYLEGALARAR